MQERQKYLSVAKWESIVGYSRAVRVGDRIYVTGTTATDKNGEIVGVGDAYLQTARFLFVNFGNISFNGNARVNYFVQCCLYAAE
ncbi:hypothetical protein BH20ACI1_BH20ACI1_12290 [soil metagenome]